MLCAMCELFNTKLVKYPDRITKLNDNINLPPIYNNSSKMDTEDMNSVLVGGNNNIMLPFISLVYWTQPNISMKVLLKNI